jgi:hypothetical protein
MVRALNRNACAKAIAIALSLNLGACFGSGSDVDVGDALQLGLGVATLGLAAASVAGGANTTTNYNVPVVQGSGTNGGSYTPRTGNGYSQKGAFDDCARLYGSVGATQQQAECRKRSSNMSSLR